MTNELSEKSRSILRALLDKKPIDASDNEISLAEFIALYHDLVKNLSSPPLAEIALLGNVAAIIFPELGPQRIKVKHNKRLNISDLSPTVINGSYFGDVMNSSLSGRVKEELRILPTLTVVFILTYLSALSIGFVPASSYGAYLLSPNNYPQVERAINLLQDVAGLLLTSATLFLSIYFVFTVTQNSELIKDHFLFRIGLVHKYHRDDILISKVGLISLAFSVVCSVLLAIPLSIEIGSIKIASQVIVANKLTLWCPILLATGATSLAYCFVSVLYFFRRNLLLVTTKVADEMLDQKFEKVKRRDKENTFR